MPLRHTAVWRLWNLLKPNHIGRRSGVNAALRKIFGKMSDLDVLQYKEFFLLCLLSFFAANRQRQCWCWFIER
jgi:hypothetical protein